MKATSFAGPLPLLVTVIVKTRSSPAWIVWLSGVFSMVTFGAHSTFVVSVALPVPPAVSEAVLE